MAKQIIKYLVNSGVSLDVQNKVSLRLSSTLFDLAKNDNISKKRIAKLRYMSLLAMDVLK
jgi:hypothetical protein